MISIIALLVSILLPALGRARELANRTVCKTNIRGFAFAINMYVGDYDERMPVYYGRYPAYRHSLGVWGIHVGLPDPPGGGPWFTGHGLLYGQGSMNTRAGTKYIDAPGAYACPSHPWRENVLNNFPGGYSTYFYRLWSNDATSAFSGNRLDENPRTAILTDIFGWHMGNWPLENYTHEQEGLNIGYGDSSVLWYSDNGEIRDETQNSYAFQSWWIDYLFTERFDRH